MVATPDPPRSPEHVTDNIAAASIELSPDELNAINDVV
jgi:aryl-alcohol dehydrogenase-like predicted oxidoreductase